MNFFRRKHGAKETSEGGPQLHHLRKLFLEYLHPSESTVLKSQEDRLYEMLPLFLIVFAKADAAQMSDRFSDVLQFAGHTSKLLVNEVQRRTSNKTIQRAVIDVIEFLIHKPKEQENNGWNLLSTLKVLSMGEVAIVECMVAASLPSAFVQMLKLFFSLKICYFEEESLNEIQKLIVPTFTKLCSYPVTAKELIRTNDLATLFDALTCSCEPQHLLWRAGVSEILTAITRNCLTKEVVDYIEEKRCISLSISNIKSMCVKNPVAIVEMLVTMICVLRDSAEVSSVLLDHFKEFGGYNFLSKLLVDFYDSDDVAVNNASRNLVILISSLALSGHKPIQVPSSVESPFQHAGFIIPTSASDSGLTVRNLDAFKVLQETVLQSTDQNLCLHILHALQNIYNSDSSNFFVLNNLHTLTQLIENAPTKTRSVQSEIFKLVEFVAFQLKWVPTQELMAMGILFKHKNLKQCQTVALHTLIRLINQNDTYKDVFREVGLLEVLINAIKEFSDQMKETCGGMSSDSQVEMESREKDEVMTDFIFLLMECLRLLIESNNANAMFFRQYRGAQCAHNLIPFRCARPYALKIIQQLIVDGGHDDLSTLLARMHTTRKTYVKLKTDILNSMLRIFAMNGQTRTIFQEVGGFVYVVAVLVSLEGSLAEPAIGCWANVERTAILELIWTIFQVLTAAMQDEPRNRVIFMDEVRFKGLTETLKLLGCFKTIRAELPGVKHHIFSPVSCLNQNPLPRLSRSSQDYMKMIVFKCLTSMATSCFENWDIDDDDFQSRASVSIKVPRIIHPGAISAVVDLLPSLWVDEEDVIDTEQMPLKDLPNVLVNVISQMQHILGSDQNQQMLCDAGLPLLLLTKCKEAFMDDDNPLNAALTKIFERLTSQSVAPDVLRSFLRLGSPLCSSSSYAMLRPVSRKRTVSESQTDTVDGDTTLNESFDERNRKRAMSLRIFDGDIRLSCGTGGSTFVEEREIDFDESTEGSNKLLLMDSNENKPVDSISVSSEFDHEIEASELSADSNSFASHEGIEEELSSDYQIDYELEVENKSIDKSTTRLGDAQGSNTATGSDAATGSNTATGSDGVTSNDVVTAESEAVTGSNDAIGSDEITNEVGTVGRDKMENVSDLENDDWKDRKADKRKGKIYNDSETVEKLHEDEKECKELKTEKVEARTLDNEKQVEEKPATVEGLMANNEMNGEEMNKKPELKKETSKVYRKEQINRSNSNRSIMKRLDSVSSNLWSSNDEEELGKDDAIIFYEKEISRSRERLEGEPPSQNIIKCLVSLTTPRDLLSVSSCEQPAFIEFDMSHDGFGYLFVGNLTPIIMQGNTGVVFNDINVNGATGSIGPINSGERTFPPPIGLTFGAWIFIERLPGQSSFHLMRLFCVQRRWISGQPRKRYSNIMFSVFLDFETNEIVVTTDKDFEPANRKSSRKAAGELRAKNDEIFTEGNWNHVCVVLNKSVVRKSTASIYANGKCIVSTSKFRYIDSRMPSGIDISGAKIAAFFGTHAMQCHISDLIWRLGPSCLLEDPLTDDAVHIMYKLGPSYSGCFQSPVVSEHYEEIGNDEPLNALIPEEKMIFMLNARNMSTMTLAKVKNNYSITEARAVSEETNISEDERFTPISIIHNSSMHFQGPSRPFGAVIIGTSGARAFSPNDVASAVMSVGGMPILLSLVAMSKNLEELYASLKALTCIVQSSRLARKEMVRIKGYQILAFLLKRKNDLLNTHILHLIFSLVGTVRSDQELGSIPNVIAFNDLLCDFEIWHNAENGLEKSLFCHFFELLTQGSECEKNISCLRRLDCVPKLLYILQDGKPPDATLQTIASVMSVLLNKSNRDADLLRFGQFMASTLPSQSSNESQIQVDDTSIITPTEEFKISAIERNENIVNMRNVLLDVLRNLLHDSHFINGIDTSFCEKLHEVLGFDWLLMFLCGHVHKHTVIRGSRILFFVLSHVMSLNAFKNGTSNGGWLKETNFVTRRRPKIAAGFAVPDSEDSQNNLEVNREALNVKGFQMLMTLFEDRTDVSELYYLLFALLLGYPITEIPSGLNLSLDSLVLLFWPTLTTPKAKIQSKDIQIYCPDAALVLLHMIRKMLNENAEESGNNEIKDSILISSIVIEFLEFLYSNIKVFGNFCMEKRFLQFLAATLYPLESKEDSFETADEDENLETVGITNHPCRSRIINFIRHILIDGIISPSFKSNSLLDTVLEAFPASANVEVLREYQSDVLLAVISHILDGGLFEVGSSKQNSLSKFASNINLFASKLVDKLWIGIFIKDYEILFGFLLKMIQKYEDGRVNPDPLYRTMNRAVLYHLSRPKNRLTDQTSLLEFLHLLTSNFRIIFSPNNRDDEFIACFTHWLLVIGLGKSQSEIDPDGLLTDSEERESITSDVDGEGDNEISANESGFVTLVSPAAKRVWDVFYQQKKDIIADVFRVQSLTPSFTSYDDVSGRHMTLDLESAKVLFGEPALRYWMNFVSIEIRKKNEAWATNQQQVTRNPVARISMRFRKDKESDEKYTIKESLNWSFHHLSIVKALTRYHYEKHNQESVLNSQSAEKSWYIMEKEVLRERGIWGPENSNPLDKWKLDLTEGPRRMRKLMCRHEHFYAIYPFRDGNMKEQVTKNRAAYSHDSKLLYDICEKYIKTDRNITPRERTGSFTWSPTLWTMEGFEGETLDVQVNSQTIIQLLETGEKIYSMYRCARLRGLDSSEGLFLFGREHFYVIDGFTLLSTEGSKGGGGDIRDIDTLPEGTHEPLIPVAKGNTIMERSFSKWSYEDVKEVHKRRYLQQNIGMEMFSNDGNNHLLVFPKKIARDKVYSRLTRTAPTQPRNVEESITGMRADVDVESGYGFFGGLIGEKHVTQRWQRGEIDNFQYLMYLNTLAGRSYNDLMQYPIFPWIIADYDSEDLDLNNEKTFRDLSKPMGAQTEYRLRQFQERFRSWEDPQNKTPPYYYGTHYSSAMIVASYLIRLEPFTEQFLRLQGGHFDLPDRLFHSIKESWLSASEHTMADVKELIPEFFYLPEFLMNQNKFDLGKKQNGDCLGDVILPPWAKNDSREFIRMHRKALECDYVSAHLHEWIDLVFGYRQQGEPAEESHNVFYHMFYEGAVDLSTIKDPVEKKSAIAVINNFGQMPKQIFRRPHPSKKTLKVQDMTSQTGTLPSPQSSGISDRLFFNSLSSLVPSVQPVKELRSAVGQIITTEKNLFAVDTKKVLLAPHYNRYISWGFSDFSLRYCSIDDKILNVFEEVFVGRILCAASLDHGSFVTGGTSTALCVWKIEKFKEKSHKLKLIKTLYGHQAPIISVATSLTYNIIVTGSEDKTAIIWDVRKLSYIRQLALHHGPVTCSVINSLTGEIITSASTWLYVWSINGNLIVCENTSSDINAHILSCCVSEMNEWDDNNVIITGSTHGIVQMWSIQFQRSEEKSVMHRVKSVEDSQSGLQMKRIEKGESNESDDKNKLKGAEHEEDEKTETKSDSDSKKGSSANLVESFVVVDHKDAKEEFQTTSVWKRRLVLRERKLTMHTAFGRKDNLEPASITALAISKDHRKIFVGDGRGRIYSWSVSDSVGAIADHWIKDEVADRCDNCDVRFTLAERRHHCRKCGKIFCAKCSQDKHPVVQLSIFKPVRVCKNCFDELRGRSSIENSPKHTSSNFE